MLTLLLGGYSEFIYDTFQGSFGWTAQINSFSFYCLQVKLCTALQTVKKQRGINMESLYQVSKLYIACYIQEYCNQTVFCQGNYEEQISKSGMPHKNSQKNFLKNLVNQLFIAACNNTIIFQSNSTINFCISSYKCPCSML